LAVTDWRLRRWRLWFLALMTATPMEVQIQTHNPEQKSSVAASAFTEDPFLHLNFEK